MGILTSAFERRALQSSSINNPMEWLTSMFGGTDSASGIKVDEDVAMTLSAVWACVRLIAGTIASEPWQVFERLENGDRRIAYDHYLYKILHDQSNVRQSAFSYRESSLSHILLWGNWTSYKVFGNDGRLKQLIPLHPSSIEPKQKNIDSPLTFDYSSGGQQRTFSAEEVFFVPGLAYNGIKGKSPIRAQHESIGTALAMQEFTARFFKNGAQESGVFKHPNELSPEAFNRLKQSITDRYSGAENAWKPMLLEDGLDWTKTLIPPEDAQLIESRRFQGVEEIARIYGVPLHLINETTKATSWGSGIEQLNIGFATHTIRHWNARIQQAAQTQLFTEADRGKYFSELGIDSMLQGDIKTQTEYFSKAITKGWMGRNEVRRLKNLNALPELDAMLQELNLGEAGAEPVPQMRSVGPTWESMRNALVSNHSWSDCTCDVCGTITQENRASGGKTRNNIQQSHRPSIAAVMMRVIKRERADIMREAKKQLKTRSLGNLEKFIDEFYTDHEEYTRDQIESVFRALAGAIGAVAAPEGGGEWSWTSELEEWLTGYVERFANQHSNYSRAQLLQLLEDVEPDDDPLEILQTRLDEWVDGRGDAVPRADKIAGAESTTLGQKFSRTVFIAAGVTTLVWRAIGDSCPYCLELDGVVVGIEQNFIDANSGFQPSGADVPMNTSSPVFEPPLHAGCECVVEPE